jgi:hypothetical protein
MPKFAREFLFACGILSFILAPPVFAQQPFEYLGKGCYQETYKPYRVYGLHAYLVNETFFAFGLGHDFKFKQNEMCFFQPLQASGWYRHPFAEYSINILGASPKCPNRTLRIEANYDTQVFHGWEQRGDRFFYLSLNRIDCPDNK